jgi:hypothetical protein
MSSSKSSPAGQEVSVKINRPRNLRFHKKYFALLGTALAMIDEDYTPEQFRAVCTAGCGYGEFIGSDKGMIFVPKSISFAAMDDTIFERLYQDTITFICKKWVVDGTQLNEIVNFM